MSDTYPTDRKKSGFAMRYTKALLRSGTVREIGSDAVLLVLLVASYEDRLHYEKPPSFWRAELMDRLGIRSPKDLVRIRNKAVAAGLLHHTQGTRTTPGLYWVLVPDWMESKIRPVPKTELVDSNRSQNGTDHSSNRSQKGTDGDSTRSRTGTGKGTGKGTLSIPYTLYPSLGDTNKRRFVPPSVSDVAQYASEIGSDIDPERFIDHYASNGWKVGKSPMKDWKACFRNWNRTAKPSSEHRPELQPMEVLR